MPSADNEHVWKGKMTGFLKLQCRWTRIIFKNTVQITLAKNMMWNYIAKRKLSHVLLVKRVWKVSSPWMRKFSIQLHIYFTMCNTHANGNSTAGISVREHTQKKIRSFPYAKKYAKYPGIKRYTDSWGVHRRILKNDGKTLACASASRNEQLVPRMLLHCCLKICYFFLFPFQILPSEVIKITQIVLQENEWAT